MSQKFPIFEISPEAPEESEAMGTKEKFTLKLLLTAPGSNLNLTEFFKS